MAGPLGYALSGLSQGLAQGAQLGMQMRSREDEAKREEEQERKRQELENKKQILGFTNDTIKLIGEGAGKDIIKARMDVLFREYGVDPGGDLAKTIGKLSTSADEDARKRGTQLLTIAALQPDQVLAFEEMFNNEPIKAVTLLEARVKDVLTKGAAGEGGGGFTLSAGQTRFGADAQPVASLPEGAPRDSALQARINALRETGVDNETAVGIATGRLVESRNAVTNEAEIIDKATGQVWRGGGGGAGMQEQPPAQDDAAIPDVLRGAVPLSLSTGLYGAAYQALNRIADAFGAPVPSPETLQGANAIRGVQLGMRNALMSEVEGRDTNALRAEYDALLVSPNSIFQGPSDALDKLAQQGRMLDREIARIQKDVLPGRVSGQAKSAAALNLSQLIQQRQALNVMLGRARAKSTGTPSRVEGENVILEWDVEKQDFK